MRRTVAVLFVSAFHVTGLLPTQEAGFQPTTVLVSIDGWRWDYDSRYQTPHLRRLAARGVRAESLVSTFPSKAFPSHYTMATGLYPGRHGIISNNIHDAATGRRFSISDRTEVQDPMWWGERRSG